jgi:hypothetical protein
MFIQNGYLLPFDEHFRSVIRFGYQGRCFSNVQIVQLSGLARDLFLDVSCALMRRNKYEKHDQIDQARGRKRSTIGKRYRRSYGTRRA